LFGRYHRPPPPPTSPPQGPRQWGEGLPPELAYPLGSARAAGTAPPPLPVRARDDLALVALLLLLGVRGATFMAAVSTEPLWSAHLWPLADERGANV
jgi:hypothetical protein